MFLPSWDSTFMAIIKHTHNPQNLNLKLSNDEPISRTSQLLFLNHINGHPTTICPLGSHDLC